MPRPHQPAFRQRAIELARLRGWSWPGDGGHLRVDDRSFAGIPSWSGTVPFLRSRPNTRSTNPRQLSGFLADTRQSLNCGSLLISEQAHMPDVCGHG